MDSSAYTKPPVRFIGYSFAFYEALYHVLRTNPEKTFYNIGTIFIVLHATFAGIEAGGSNMIIAVIDTLIFELIASLAVPVLLAKACRQMTTNILSDLNIHYRVTQYGPALLSLALIVAISVPLDNFTNKILDQTLRAMM